MRALRITVATCAVLAGLALAAPAHAAPLAFFNEQPASADTDYNDVSGTPLVGDFDGDGRDDVFFYRPGAAGERIKFGTTTGFENDFGADLSVSGTFTPLVGDYDGNGVTDVFWYAPGKAADYLWLFFTGGSHTSTAKPVNGTFKPIVGDFASNDEQSRDDIFWYAPGTGADFLWKAGPGASFTSIARTINGTYTPVVGSFTPDPSTGGSTDSTLDIFWYASGPTVDSLWKGNGAGAFTSKAFNAPDGAVPVVGYFDGYGVQDILWNRAAGADSVWLADPDTLTFSTHPANVPSTAKAIVGEWLVPDEPILLWSPNAADHLWFPQGEPGTWDYYELSNNTDMGAGYVPVTGDFNGDGHRDLYWIKYDVGGDRLWYGPNSGA
ncbi:hypothetical protein KSP35_16935 [Aquihabitans sp. G128]|uniref:hypothetical protein n=1 Tax=Aquihabitans sp. G128 TaxID=2849779 RepID=UPI001C2349BB|nr:hypothetical protein [Aquihabitans sp. G128]QXC60036.1 hypothetical protein KSP35_16935 [Aquihabitans sp. G128]